MTRRTTLKRLWHAMGLMGALALGLAWKDSRTYCSTADGGWYPDYSWKKLEIVSFDSGLHLLLDTRITINIPTPTPPGFYRRKMERWYGSLGWFPKPFVVWQKTAMPGAPIAAWEGQTVRLRRGKTLPFSPTVIDGKILPPLMSVGAPASDLCLPYWLLLTGWVGIWMMTPLLSRWIIKRWNKWQGKEVPATSP